MRLFTTLAVAAMLAAGSMTGAMAQTFTETNSLSVTLFGPYTSGSGYTDSSLYAVSESQDPGNQSFGVLDFSGITAPAYHVSTLTVSLAQYTNAYASSGPLDFYISTGTTPIVGNQPALYNAAYDSSQADGIASSLIAAKLGTASYVAGSKGTPASYTFDLSSDAESALQNSFKAGDLQILMGAPVNGTTEAQFDGVYYTPATVTFGKTAPVPEASSVVSFGLLLAFGGIIATHRRKIA